MNPSLVILSFLAARWPSAYDIAAIARRATASGMLDSPLTEAAAAAELLTLSDVRGYAAHAADTMSGRVYWTATREGVAEWVRRGSPQIT